MNVKPYWIPVIGASALVLAVCLTVVIVLTMRQEGARTREAMAEISDSTVVSKSLDRALGSTSSNPTVVSDILSKNSPEIASKVASQTSTILQEAKELLKNATRSEETEKPENEISRQAESEDSHAIASSLNSNVASDLFNGFLTAGQGVIKTADEVGQTIVRLSSVEENELGRELHKQMREKNRLLNSPELSTRLKKLALPLLSEESPLAKTLSIDLVESPTRTSFSHVGGYVYLDRGLLEFVSNDAELQFVLGRELAHLELNHCSERVAYAARASKFAGTLGQEVVELCYGGIASSYSADKEAEADVWSYKRITLKKAAAIEYLERLARTFETEVDTQSLSNALLERAAKLRQTKP